MAQVISDTPDRTRKDVVRDLARVLDGIGDDAPALQVVMSVYDFQLLRGLAGEPGLDLTRDYPAVAKCLKMNVTLDHKYNGPPRIVRPLGIESFDANAELAKRDQLKKTFTWRETDERLRRGIDGRPLA